MKRFLVGDLEAHLRGHWPASVAHVSYDDRGFLVAEFNLLAAAAEGDVLGYMNRLQPAGFFYNTARDVWCVQVQQGGLCDTLKLQAEAGREDVGPHRGRARAVRVETTVGQSVAGGAVLQLRGGGKWRRQPVVPEEAEA